MRKSLKFLAIGLATASCCFAVGCDGASSESSSSIDKSLGADAVAENEYLLSGMNNYHEITGFDVGRMNMITVNRDANYIKGGDASAKIYFEDITGRIENAYAMTIDKEIPNAKEMEEISFWVYSANDYATDFIFAGYDTASRVIFSDKAVLAANAWTEISIPIDRYQMKLINPTLRSFRFVYDTHGEKVATFYMDSFKAKLNDEEPQTQTKTSFESGEILNFNTLADLVWATPVRRNSYGEIITIPIYDYAVSAPFSEDGGALRLGVNRLTTLRSSTVIWNGSYQLTELTGFKVPTALLDKVDLAGMTKLSVDVYHDYTQARQLTFTITDEGGTSATVSAWVEPNEWTTLAIEDFGIVDLTRIVAIEFFYTEYMTFEDYNIYVDNLCYVKEA